jgi:uncharacterized protein YbbC (DUF1343 family)
VLTGLDQIADYQHLFKNKKIGIITNHTAVNRQGEHITDIFLNLPDVTVAALFGPEHGVRGQAVAGERVESQVDPLTDIPVYSLYGASKKPTPEMLKNIDVLVFDIQDIGARFYTYIWTMFYALQAAAENNITFVVLDRPNPITGKIEGPILEQEFSSFVGLQPIPIRHGLTIGELAKMFVGEKWIGETKTELIVVPIKNWRRDMWFDETGLQFIPPSPNMPTLETATIYPGTCLLEGTNVSEGRGTDTPFLLFGAPWINADRLCAQLNRLELTGVHFEPAEFTPMSLPGKAPNPKYENKKCFGAKIHITNRDSLNAYACGMHIIKMLQNVYPNDFEFRRDGFFDKLCGTAKVRIAIENGERVENILNVGYKEQEAFLNLREKYLLYP